MLEHRFSVICEQVVLLTLMSIKSPRESFLTVRGGPSPLLRRVLESELLSPLLPFLKERPLVVNVSVPRPVSFSRSPFTRGMVPRLDVLICETTKTSPFLPSLDPSVSFKGLLLP